MKTATGVAVRGVLAEIGVISWALHDFMGAPRVSAGLRVALGGALVFLTGILIGNS